MSDVTKFKQLSNSALCRAFGNVGLLLTALTLGGCMSSVTTTMQASSDIAAYSVASYDKLHLSDEILADALTIQRVVSKSGPQFLAAVADLDESGSADLSAPTGITWVNNVSGSQGEITYISEKPSGSTVCRNFKSSLLNFEGVGLYNGISCKSSSGGWTLKSFYQVS